ncbi:MAG: hypothetical protein WD738_19035 [Pirellulales bacterium]
MVNFGNELSTALLQLSNTFSGDAEDQLNLRLRERLLAQTLPLDRQTRQLNRLTREQLGAEFADRREDK